MRASDPTGIPATGSDAPSLQDKCWDSLPDDLRQTVIDCAWEASDYEFEVQKTNAISALMRASDPTGIPATGSDAPSLQALTLRGILAVDGDCGQRGHLLQVL
mgnify:CR=1 FL=1